MLNNWEVWLASQKKFMDKKIIIFLFLIAGAALFSGCGGKEGSAENSDGIINQCKAEKVSLSNYGDQGDRLENCFVKYPGEPTREDTYYYIVEDICGQFTKEFVENLLGKNVVKVEPPKKSRIYNCSYYLDEKEYLTLSLEYLLIENEERSYDKAGNEVEKNPQIPMDNLVVTEGGYISRIFFILSPDKFISLSPASKNTIEKGKILEFASKLGEAIKKYK